MNRKELINQTEGAFLRKNYLEAFLVQSAYIESVLKFFIDVKFFVHLTKNHKTCPFINTLRKKNQNMGLHEII